LGSFVDRLLVQFRDPAKVVAMLAPPADPTNSRLKGLLEAVYDQPFAVVRDIRNPTIRGVEFERPIDPPRRRRGTWMQTAPVYMRTDVSYEDRDTSGPIWLDVVVDLEVDLLLEVDPGQVESIVTREIEGFSTLDEFKARFQFLDLDAFLARLGITTVDELKSRYPTLLTEIRLEPSPPFDPDDPANLRRYPLRVAMLIREALDVAGLLREAKQTARALTDALAFAERFEVSEVRSPFGVMVVVPDSVLAGQPLVADDIRALFATERIPIVFTTPA
jgi:hypothetical protein